MFDERWCYKTGEDSVSSTKDGVIKLARTVTKVGVIKEAGACPTPASGEDKK